MNAKKWGKRLLFLPMTLLWPLLFIATGWLLYALWCWEEHDPRRIASYVLAFYTLTVWCVRLPHLVRRFRQFKQNNRYWHRWSCDAQWRMNITLTVLVGWNVAYALLQLGLGIVHHAAWYYSLAGYYGSLAVMRFFLVRHTRRHKPGEHLRQELAWYRLCGWVFLFMNLALSGMMLWMIREDRTMRHHEITTIAMAAYTFTTLTVAIVNVVRYRRYHSPAMSASKAVSLAAAAVSMLTLENTMLTTFSRNEMSAHTRRLFLGLSGGGVSVGIILMALYMICQSSKKRKDLESDT